MNAFERMWFNYNRRNNTRPLKDREVRKAEMLLFSWPLRVWAWAASRPRKTG